MSECRGGKQGEGKRPAVVGRYQEVPQSANGEYVPKGYSEPFGDYFRWPGIFPGSVPYAR